MALERLDKILASLGYCSRSNARRIIRSGSVAINGVTATAADQKAERTAVTLDGQELDHPRGILISLHKPCGYVCSHESGEGPRIYDLLPDQWLLRNPAVTSIGRLDKESSGLILVTDQMMMVHTLTSPKSAINKIYEVTVDRPLEALIVDRFGAGTMVLGGEDDACLPAKLVITGSTTATVTVTEGRYHLVRRMFGACGYEVVKLHRTEFGPYKLGDLAEESWRDEEILTEN